MEHMKNANVKQVVMYEIILLFLMKQALPLSFFNSEDMKNITNSLFCYELMFSFNQRSRDRKIAIIKFRDHLAIIFLK